MSLLEDIKKGKPVAYLRKTYPQFDEGYYEKNPKYELVVRVPFGIEHVCRRCNSVFFHPAIDEKHCNECAIQAFEKKQERIKKCSIKHKQRRKRIQNRRQQEMSFSEWIAKCASKKEYT